MNKIPESVTMRNKEKEWKGENGTSKKGERGKGIGV